MDEKTWLERTAAMREKIEGDIEQVGWSSIGVFNAVGDEPTPSFTYTIGLRETYDHPELIVYGLEAETAHGLIASAVDLLKEGAVLEDGGRYAKVLRGHDVAARLVPEPGYPLNVARMYYGDDVRAVQLVWPDAAGKFPWEEDFDQQFDGLQVFPDGTEADA